MNKILDACCGSKMFWFNKKHPLTTYQDIREESTTLCDGRQFIVAPDTIGDFTNMSWPTGKFKIVVLDPPHLSIGGDKGWQCIKYGKLPSEWKQYISDMFRECFRVLELDGILIFKWNETQIKVNEIISLSEYEPLIGQIRAGKSADTHWIIFHKTPETKR